MEKITSRKKLILYGCSGLGVNMLTLLVGSYLCSALLTGGFKDDIEMWTYLNKDLVIASVWGIIIFFAKAVDGFIDLPFAFLIARINNKFGRRKTGLLIGYIPMIISFILFFIVSVEAIVTTLVLNTSLRIPIRNLLIPSTDFKNIFPV